MHAQNRLCHLSLALVVLCGAAAGIVKQALAQNVTEFPVPTASSNPFGITTGPDGALWFTESSPVGSSGNNIGRITTADVITEFPIPTPGSRPQGITAGPDGALWF